MRDGQSLTIERLSRVLGEVGLRDGIPNLRLGPEGTAALLFTGGRTLGFEYNEEQDLLVLHMPLLDLPAQAYRRAALFESALKMSYLDSASDGWEVAIDERGRQAIFQSALPATGLDADTLDREIDRFLRQREACRQALQNPRARSEGLAGGQSSRRQEILHTLPGHLRTSVLP